MTKFGKNNPNYKYGGVFMKPCLQCGESFNAGYQHKTRKYCSTACFSISPVGLENVKKAQACAPRPKKYVAARLPNCICKLCGKRFLDTNTSRRVYCSYECSYQSKRTRKPTACSVCGTMHLLKNRVTCSEPCKVKWQALKQSGSKSHRWEGGKLSEAMRIRGSREYSQWRTAVYERDDYTCKLCGVRGGRLHADHIKPFALYPELRLDLNNGRTLCAPCHFKTDTWGIRTAHQKRAAA